MLAARFLSVMHQVVKPAYASSGKGHVHFFCTKISNFLKAFQAEQYLDQVFLDKAAEIHLLAQADSLL